MLYEEMTMGFLPMTASFLSRLAEAVMPKSDGDETPGSLARARLSLADFEALEHLKNDDQPGDVLLERIEQAFERRKAESIKLSQAAAEANEDANQEDRNFDAIAKKSAGGRELKESKDEIEHKRQQERDLLARSHEVNMQLQRLEHERALAGIKAKHERALAMMKVVLACAPVLVTGLVGTLAKTDHLPSFLAPNTTPKGCSSAVLEKPTQTTCAPLPAVPAVPAVVANPALTPCQHPTPSRCSYKKQANDSELDVSARSAQCRQHFGNGTTTFTVSATKVVCQCP